MGEIIISNQLLDNLDNFENYMKSYVNYNENELLAISGQEHYRLLSFLSLQFNNSIIYDIGTRFGGSAISLSLNPNNKIKSFNIKNELSILNTPDNIEWVYEDDVTKRSELLSTKLIMLDVDPHDGIYEKHIIDYLIKNKWDGVILFDDTKKEYWPDIYNLLTSYENNSFEILNFTKYGHFSGTLCFNFSNIKFKLN